MEKNRRWKDFILYTALTLMLGALAIYAYLGFFTRYMADDYITAASLRRYGFWGSQLYWWKICSGRYSFTFMVTFVELFGLRIVPILPTLVISMWLFSIVWACLPLMKALKFTRYVPTAFFVARAALWLIYRSVKDYPQIVFWQTGILTYPITPILFLIGAGIVIRQAFQSKRAGWLATALWFLFALAAGGFSETGVAMQIALLAALLACAALRKDAQKNTLIPILLAALCGSLISLFVISVAPGNLHSSNGFQDLPPLNRTVLKSFIEALLFIPRFIDRHTVVFIFSFLCGVFLVNFSAPGWAPPDNFLLARNFGASLLFVEAGIWAGIFPAYWVWGVLPPE